MKRWCAILTVTLAVMWAGYGSTSAATLYAVVTDQLMSRYHLDTTTSRIEILSSQLVDTTVSPEAVKIQPLFPKEPLGLVSIVVEIATPDHSFRRGQMSLRVRRYSEVFVATGEIKTHELIDLQELKLQTMEVTSLREQPVVSLGNIQGYRSKRNLSSGQILTFEAIESVPDIEVGREVSILCEGGSFTISAHGKAMQTGRLGEMIRVRNSSSGRVVLARVSGSGEVTVEM